MKHGKQFWLVRSGLCALLTAQASLAQMPDGLKTERVVRRDFEQNCAWFGTVTSPEQCSVRALTDGRFLSFEAADAKPVQAGDLLFTLGGPQIDSRRNSLRASLDGLNQQRAEAHKVLALRREALAEKLASREDVSDAERAEVELETRIHITEQELHQLEEVTHPRAAKDGVFTGRRVAAGQDVIQGEVLADLVPTLGLRIVATLFPPQGVAIAGKEARIHTTHADGVQAAVARVMPSRTAEGATVAWIEGPAIGSHLHPGETASGTVRIEDHPSALAVPRAAIVRDDTEQPYVFVRIAAEDHKRAVQIGLQQDDWVEILGGVEADDEVVTQGAYGLFHRDFSKTFKVPD